MHAALTERAPTVYFNQHEENLYAVETNKQAIIELYLQVF